MKVVFIFIFVCSFLLDQGVSDAGSDQVQKLVKEGDPVTLHTGVEINQQNRMIWYFNTVRIAYINGDPSKTCTDVKCNEGTERFRDRLKLDHQTGSLTIMNIRTTDSGEYKLLIRSSEKIFSVTVIDSNADKNERETQKEQQDKNTDGSVFSETVSVTEGDSVTLNTDLTEIPEDDEILWKYGAEKSLIAQIRRAAGVFSTFDVPDGRFRDRLKLDRQTGSLTITNITTQHAGLYTLELRGAELSSQTYHVSVYAHLPVPVISNNSSQCSSSSSSSSSSSQQNCSLLCSVVNVGHVTLSWYKGNSLLSSISVSDLSISLSLPLEVEYQEKNSYSCVINNPIRNQTTHLDISKFCQPCSEVHISCCDTVEAVMRLVVTALVGVASAAAAVLLLNDVRSARG